MFKRFMIVSFALLSVTAYASEVTYVLIKAETVKDRNKIANLGFAIEQVSAHTVIVGATKTDLTRLIELNIAYTPVLETLTFPSEDSDFHDYEEVVKELFRLEKEYPTIFKIYEIGKTWEQRTIYAGHFTSSNSNMLSNLKPGAVYMGGHHAREHLSVEVPLLFANYLAINFGNDPEVTKLIETRDIWIIPQVNPDGSEYDISGESYKHWRKNRRDNQDGNYGVDLNRNYGFKWGTGGSSSNTDSDVYKGPSPFSEPETGGIKEFIEAHKNIRTLLTFHTFSELIVYPWGHKNEAISKKEDLLVYEKLANKMSKWNGYKTGQVSNVLYIASGDTCDWAYGELGIFAFTFELFPKSFFGGGFYPSAKVIQRVFEQNLKPALYLADVADDPYKVLLESEDGFFNFSSDYFGLLKMFSISH